MTPPPNGAGQGARLCRELLVSYVREREGVVGAALDLESSALTVYYDPGRLSFERAEQLAIELVSRLRPRLKGCPAAMRVGVRLESSVLAGPGASSARTPVVMSDPAEELRGFPSVRRPLAIAEEGGCCGEGPEVGAEVQLGLAGACLACLLASVAGVRYGLVGPAADTALGVIAYVAGGALSSANALRGLARRVLDIDSLMVVAALGAAAINRWHEGAILLFLFSLSNAMEALAMKRTRGAITSLIGLSPQEARVRTAGGERQVPIRELDAGQLVEVRPGERIPVDGTVREGESDVDGSMLTGESRWSPKGAGDPVFAGTLNQTGLLVVEAASRAEESYLSRVIRMVEAAQATKASTERLVDRFGRVYTPLVLAVALAMFLGLALLLGHELGEAFYRSMVLLVIASPCALVLATPSAILSAIGHGARQGILFKGGVFVERLAEVRMAAFDKTGVLTTGLPRVTAVEGLGRSGEDVLADAATLERHSDHPLAKAVTNEANRRGVSPGAVDGLASHHGLGMSGDVNGRRVWVGSASFASRRGVGPDGSLREKLEEVAGEGRSSILVGEGSRITGWLALEDEPRAGAASCIGGLRRQGLKPIVMVTGDHPSVARKLSRELGLDGASAGLLPDEKLKVIRQQSQAAGPAVMVGDGVNDGPALAAAHVGVTLGMASDVALEVADVVLVTNDLTRLPYAVRLARKARRVVGQNLLFAAVVIACGIPLAIYGIVTLPVGVVLHEGSTLLVVANGLRLLKKLPDEG